MSTIKVDTLQTRSGNTAAVTGSGFVATDQIRGNTSAASITLGDGSNTLGALSTAGGVTITGEGGTVTTNLQQGLAKSWIDIVQTSGSQAIADSFNITGITDTAAGQTTVTIANDMASANYCCTTGTNQVHSVINSGTTTTGVYRTEALNSSNADTDSAYVGTTIHGDLA